MLKNRKGAQTRKEFVHLFYFPKIFFAPSPATGLSGYHGGLTDGIFCDTINLQAKVSFDNVCAVAKY
jgi:hypothetical protein